MGAMRASDLDGGHIIGGRFDIAHTDGLGVDSKAAKDHCRRKKYLLHCIKCIKFQSSHLWYKVFFGICLGSRLIVYYADKFTNNLPYIQILSRPNAKNPHFSSLSPKNNQLHKVKKRPDFIKESGLLVSRRLQCIQ